jgi:uncharacterized membrane protein YfcA
LPKIRPSNKREKNENEKSRLSDPMDSHTLFQFIGGFGIAVVVGALTGIFGVGGGFLATPALMIFLGIPGPVAVGTGVAMICVTSSFGLFKRRGTHTIDITLGLVMGATGCIGVVAGIAAIEWLKRTPPLVILGHEQAAVQFVLLVCFAVLLTGIAVFMACDCRNNECKIGKGLLTAIRLPPYLRPATLAGQKLPLIPLLLVAITIGAMTGLLGIGGGVILVPCLIYLLGQNGRDAAGTSLLIIWLSTLIGGIGHLKGDNVDGWLFMAMLAGGMIGTHYGTHIGLKLDHPRICRYFSYTVGIMAIIVIYKLCKVTLG